MAHKHNAILHVDGSLTEYLDKRGVLHKVAGLGGYLVMNGKIIDKFHKTLKDVPHMNHHEEYAIIEGLKWLKDKKINSVRIKSDSLTSVHLFSHQKKNLTKADKFFLLQYMMIEYSFEDVEVLHHSRTEDDLSHQLSRFYLNNLPENITKLHQETNKKKKDYDIAADAAYHCERDIMQILLSSMKEIQLKLHY